MSKALFSSTIPLYHIIGIEKRNHGFTQLLQVDLGLTNELSHFVIDLFVFHFFWFGAPFTVISVKWVDRIHAYCVRDSLSVSYSPLLDLASPWRDFQIRGYSLGLFSQTLGQGRLLGAATTISLPECLAGFSNSVCPQLNSSLFTWVCLDLLLKPDHPFKLYWRETWQ